MENLELIVDENTSLSLYQEKDAKELFTLINSNHTHFKEWLPWLDYNTKVEDTQKFILECNANYKKGVNLTLGIHYEGKIVGSVSFNTISPIHKKAEIGYMLSEDYTGKGIMIKCCKALINFGFEKLKLNRVAILCATENIKSRAAPEKLGFKLEGILEQNEWLLDRFVDHAHYGMLNENWK